MPATLYHLRRGRRRTVYTGNRGRKRGGVMKTAFKARQLLVLAYLLAAVFWVVRCLVGCGVMLNYQLQGKMPQTHLDAAELVTESFAPYSSNEWWTRRTMTLRGIFRPTATPASTGRGRVYRNRGFGRGAQAAPGRRSAVLPETRPDRLHRGAEGLCRVTAPGVYTFDLGGKWVTGLRIDPTVWAACRPLHRHRAEPRAAVVSAVYTSAGWWLVLAFGPAVAAAFCSLFAKRQS